jgi:hypothetical protein
MSGNGNNYLSISYLWTGFPNQGKRWTLGHDELAAQSIDAELTCRSVLL